MNKWFNIAGSLMIGLFVAYLDRTNLSVGLPAVATDLGFAGDNFAATSSLALTIFLVGYAVANVVGGIATQRFDPKTVVIWCYVIWSLATIVAGMATALWVLLACRLILGIAEGVYWPQQSRFARGWFAAHELTRANSLIQYYGQYLALAVGFMILTPVFNAFGWRVTFYVTGGLVLVIVPLYGALLKPQSAAPYKEAGQARRRLTWRAVGGAPFCLLVFSYITQGMLFWGITLWIPLAVKSLGFTGMSQAVASALPYAAAVLFAIPLSIISDRTNKRVTIAGLGLLIPGVMLLLLPQVDSASAKLALITIALGYYAGSYTPNIWSILQSTVEPEAVGPASGIINGLGAGGGGTLAGFLVGLLRGATGSYIPGFMALGGLVVLGSLALFAYGRLTSARQNVAAVR
jgi:MFS family permease